MVVSLGWAVAEVQVTDMMRDGIGEIYYGAFTGINGNGVMCHNEYGGSGVGTILNGGWWHRVMDELEYEINITGIDGGAGQ